MSSTDVNLQTIPALLPGNVARVDPATGLPTRFLLNQELAQNNWYSNSVVDLQTQITTVSSQTDVNTASITTEITARTSADEALADQITTLTATVGTNTANLSDEVTARADGDSALAAEIVTLEADVGANTAAISAETIARADGDSALATQVTDLTTTVGSNTADLTTLAASVSGVEVRYGIQGTINNVTGGFIFQGVLKNDGSVSYDMEFDSNVTINGDLLVNGTVTRGGLADDAVTLKYDLPKQSNHAIYPGATGTTFTAFNVITEAGVPIQATFTVTQDTPIEVSINPAIFYQQAAFKLAVFKNGVFEAPMGLFQFSGSGANYCGTSSDTSGVQGTITWKSVLTPGTWTLDVRVSQLGNVIGQSQTLILAGTRITMLATGASRPL